jgi:hypothetical protein
MKHFKGYWLAVDVLAHIELDPASWDQGSWAKSRNSVAPRPTEPGCGTGMCFAGWAVTLGAINPQDRIKWIDEGTYGGEPIWVGNTTKSGLIVSERASRLLELETNPELFAGRNNLHDLYREVAVAYNKYNIQEVIDDVAWRMKEVRAEYQRRLPVVQKRHSLASLLEARRIKRALRGRRTPRGVRSSI